MAKTYSIWRGKTHLNITITGSGLIATNIYSTAGTVKSSIPLRTGKHYCEMTISEVGTGGAFVDVGTSCDVYLTYGYPTSRTFSYRSSTGQFYIAGAGSAYGDTFTDGDIIGIALDVDNQKVWFSKNGTWQNGGDPSAGTNPASSALVGNAWIVYAYLSGITTSVTLNSGASAFTHSVPTGFNSGYYYEGGVYRGGDVTGDDAQVISSSSLFQVYSADTYLGNWTTTQYECLMRFPSISVGNGMIINEAYITVASTGQAENGTPDIDIYGVDADNQGNITTYSEYAALPLTTAKVDWMPTWDHDSFAFNNTADISAIISEIVSRPGWVLGNAITLIMRNSTGAADALVRFELGYMGTEAQDIQYWGPVLYITAPEGISVSIPAFTSQAYGNFCANVTIPAFRATLTGHDSNVHITSLATVSIPAFTAVLHANVSSLSPQPTVTISGTLSALVGQFYGGGIVNLEMAKASFLSTGSVLVSGSMDLALKLSVAITGSATIAAFLNPVIGKSSFSAVGWAGLTSTMKKSFVLSFASTGLVGVVGTMSLPIAFGTTTLSAALSPLGTASFTIKFGFGAEGSQTSYRSMVMNLKNYGLTEYLNYNFNSLCSFDGKYFGSNTSGIYELTGTQDVSTNIPWRIVTPRFDLETDNVRKILRHAWLGYKSSGDLTLTVILPDATEYEYTVDSVSVVDDGIRVKFGKGIKSRYVEMELKNNANESIILDKFRIFTEPTTKKR